MATRTAGRRPSPAEQVARDETKAERLAELHARLAAGVAELVEGDEWRRMLEAVARFHQYSWRNVMLILAQFPKATRVAGYKAWQDMGRQVRKGEHGFDILGGRDVYAEVEDPETGEKERGKLYTRYFPCRVFDISQTDGDDIPEVRPIHLEGDAPEGLWDALAAQVAAAGFSLTRRRPTSPGANGETNAGTRSVVVGDHLGEAQAARTLIHELAHVLLEHGSESCQNPRSQKEVEAESVAFVVATAVGMDPASYSLPYVAGWANGDLDLVEKTADLVV